MEQLLTAHRIKRELLISIITPCYNQGQYLDDAINSIKAIDTPYMYEHIIINDGSTDGFTINKLNELGAQGYTIIHQENIGLPKTRNKGIALAKGKYVIPLDADNKLSKPYLTTAIDIMEKKPDIDVVYGDSIFFGNENLYNKNIEFDSNLLLECNYIDACAVVRKTMLEKTNGYDINMPGKGFEDWELWINILFKGGKFYHLDDLCFYYRVTDHSMRLNECHLKEDEDKAYILRKHSPFLLNFFKENYWRVNYLKKERIKGSLNILLGRVF